MIRKINDINQVYTESHTKIEKFKPLKIKNSLSLVDKNTINLPCLSEYRDKPYAALEYIWIDKIGKPYKRGIRVKSHENYGIPTLRDLTVLIALQNIFIKKKTKNGVCTLKISNISEDDLKIKFTINELARELGYSFPTNNKIRNNIKKSINILVATTITNIYDGGIYDVKSKNYIKNPTKEYHYLERCIGYEKLDSTGNLKTVDVTKIKISRFFYDMIIGNYFVLYDRETFNSIKNLISKKIYLLVLHWMKNLDTINVTMDTLIDYIPTAQEKYKYQKQYIKKALDYLHVNNFLDISYGDTITIRKIKLG